MEFTLDKAQALELDKADPLKEFRHQFLFPKNAQGIPYRYFCGNSLGLQPKSTSDYINKELQFWEQYGVEGHFKAEQPWFSYHEAVTESLAKLVGAKPNEVVAMNSLTVNLHLAMVSFYNPVGDRNKILIEKGAFPSDYYAVKSQIRQRGLNPSECLLELTPRPGEKTLRTEDIVSYISENGSKISCIMIGGVQYLTGQLFDMAAITKEGHKQGCLVGFDLAHAAGNVLLKLHDWGVDFAAWCSYKYLNSGPGGIAGFYVHEKHTTTKNIKRFEGWWGTNKDTRFKMEPENDPIPSAESWQLSNPPIFQLAAMRASLDLFDKATMKSLREKSLKLTRYFEFLVDNMPGKDITINTPRDPSQRGAQLSLELGGSVDRSIVDKLEAQGIICDFRMPNIVRAAPAPLYNNYSDVYALVEVLKKGV